MIQSMIMPPPTIVRSISEKALLSSVSSTFVMVILMLFSALVNVREPPLTAEEPVAVAASARTSKSRFSTCSRTPCTSSSVCSRFRNSPFELVLSLVDNLAPGEDVRGAGQGPVSTVCGPFPLIDGGSNVGGSSSDFFFCSSFLALLKRGLPGSSSARVLRLDFNSGFCS